THHGADYDADNCAGNGGGNGAGDWATSLRMSDITAWVTRSCADLGLVVSSPGERTHDQPWSVAVAHDIHLPTAPTVGLVQGQRDRHPSRARADLGPGLVVPDLVPEVLAIDAERAWSL